MRRFFSESQWRQLTLLNYLFESKQQYESISDLIKITKSSYPSIKADIKYLSENFSDWMTIKEDTRGIRVKFKDSIRYFNFYNLYLNETIGVRILLKVFCSNKWTVNQLANTLYSSPSTIYRTIESINCYLNDYVPDIYLSKNPVQLRGPEKQIRFFFYHVLTIVSDCQTICSNKKLFPTVRFIISHLFHFLPDLDIFECSSSLYRRAMINLVRYQQGYSLEKSFIDPYGVELIDSYKHYLMQFEDQATASLELDEKLILECLWGIIPACDFLRKSLWQKIVENDQNLIQLYASFSKSLYQTFKEYKLPHLTHANKKQIFYILYNCSLTLKEMEDLPEMFQLATEDIILFQTKNALKKEFIQDLSLIIADFFNKLTAGIASSHTVQYLTHYFYTLMPEVDEKLELSLAKPNVLIHTNNYYHSLSIEHSIQRFFANECHPYIWQSVENYEEFSNKQFPIVISSQEIPIKINQHVLIVKDQLTLNDYHWLLDRVIGYQNEFS